MAKVSIVVVGQTPPPFHGQAIMTQYFLEGRYESIELHHVRMAFSEEINQVGKMSFGKIVHLLGLIVRITAARIRLKPRVLYFPPAGPNLVPFLRDCVFLISTRWMFQRTVFHFHAAGLSELFARLPGPLKILFRLAYDRPDVAISISKDGMRDAAFLRAKQTALVPNGIPDVWPVGPGPRRNIVPTVLFLAMVCEEKGAGILIEACKILHSRGVKFRCKIAGRAPSEGDLVKLRERAAALGDCLEFIGPVTGKAKWELFAASDIFCFPTYYTSESFGLVAVEAMMSGLPVVATNWRALPEIVAEGETGFLVPAHDAFATARQLEILLINPTLRKSFGDNARKRYEQRYTVATFHSKMEAALCSIG